MTDGPNATDPQASCGPRKNDHRWLPLAVGPSRRVLRCETCWATAVVRRPPINDRARASGTDGYEIDGQSVAAGDTPAMWRRAPCKCKGCLQARVRRRPRVPLAVLRVQPCLPRCQGQAHARLHACQREGKSVAARVRSAHQSEGRCLDRQLANPGDGANDVSHELEQPLEGPSRLERGEIQK